MEPTRAAGRARRVHHGRDQRLVWRRGVEVLRWQRDGAREVREVASVQKSVTSLLVGRAAQDGLVAVDDLVATYLGPDWTGQSSGTKVSLRHLLTMTSGLDERLAEVAAPGERWYYNSIAYERLHRVLEQVTGSSMDELARTWLFDPIGATSFRFVQRAGNSTDPIAQLGLVGSADDLVKVGALVLAGGAPLLDDRSWLDASFSPIEPNPSYGYLWWLNGQDGGRLPGPMAASFSGPLIPTAPAGMVAALGKDDQKLYIVPDDEIIVVRTGDRAGPRAAQALSSFDSELWTHLQAILSL